MQVVALLTDFGTEDGFIGAVKGVISSINPSVQFIDITHSIKSFDIFEGALILNATYRYFPKGTIFFSVVDPGVGTERNPIAVQTKDYFFVAPDNGILSIALKNEKILKIVKINSKDLLPERDTETFHGRDIFAPAVGYISRGCPLELIGEELNDYIRIDFPEPEVTNSYLIGEIIKFDKFGNGITNIKELPPFDEIEINGIKLKKVVKGFLEGDKGSINLIKGSFGFYEVFSPKESAEQKFNLKKGDKIKIKLKR
ncbi:SAM hydrolase/SAM-dependent halogenase family protein [Persephonella sp.]